MNDDPPTSDKSIQNIVGGLLRLGITVAESAWLRLISSYRDARHTLHMPVVLCEWAVIGVSTHNGPSQGVTRVS